VKYFTNLNPSAVFVHLHQFAGFAFIRISLLPQLDGFNEGKTPSDYFCAGFDDCMQPTISPISRNFSTISPAVPLTYVNTLRE